MRFSERKSAGTAKRRDTTLLHACLAANASVSAKTHPCDITVTPDGIYLPPIPNAFNPQLTRGIHQIQVIVLHRPTTLCHLVVRLLILAQTLLCALYHK